MSKVTASQSGQPVSARSEPPAAVPADPELADLLACDRPLAHPQATAPVTEAQLVELFNALRDELVSMLLYLLGNAEDAQDAAQEAFLKCWRARQTMGEVQNLRAWIFRVGLNAARDMQRSAWNRKSKPLIGEENMLVDRGSAVGQSLEDQESLERLRQAIHHLSQAEKEVFLLRQNGELTYEQIAQIRSLPVGTVKTQMRSALQKLRKVLG
jgi:RNA polymerase sigma-70 factor (ECF subfamily)